MDRLQLVMYLANHPPLNPLFGAVVRHPGCRMVVDLGAKDMVRLNWRGTSAHEPTTGAALLRLPVRSFREWAARIAASLAGSSWIWSPYFGPICPHALKETNGTSQQPDWNGWAGHIHSLCVTQVLPPRISYSRIKTLNLRGLNPGGDGPAKCLQILAGIAVLPPRPDSAIVSRAGPGGVRVIEGLLRLRRNRLRSEWGGVTRERT
jgi:hypothetical protein